MKTLSEEQIKEIAEQIDFGYKCFWNRQEGELIFIPDELRHIGIDMDAWEDEVKKVEENWDLYEIISPLGSRDSFKIMSDFVDTLGDSNRLKYRLIDALNKRKPFREFKFVIDNSGDYRQHWFDFKNEWLEEWVRERVKEIEEEE